MTLRWTLVNLGLLSVFVTERPCTKLSSALVKDSVFFSLLKVLKIHFINSPSDSWLIKSFMPLVHKTIKTTWFRERWNKVEHLHSSGSGISVNELFWQTSRLFASAIGALTYVLISLTLAVILVETTCGKPMTGLPDRRCGNWYSSANILTPRKCRNT